tara:strand:+ start:300 stop:728 length:429 start_codon:yes stop_codon:yes gene_type:complete
MKGNIILYICLICGLFKVLWDTMIIESFDYQKECTDELADSIKVKRTNEEAYKLSQSNTANNTIPTSLDNLETAFYDMKGNIPKSYESEQNYKDIVNNIIDNTEQINAKDKLAVAKGSLVDFLSRYEIILNDGSLSNLADYQ